MFFSFFVGFCQIEQPRSSRVARTTLRKEVSFRRAPDFLATPKLQSGDAFWRANQGKEIEFFREIRAPFFEKSGVFAKKLKRARLPLRDFGGESVFENEACWLGAFYFRACAYSASRAPRARGPI